MEKKVEEIPAGQQSEGSPAPPKDETPREPFLGRLKAVVLILLIVLVPAGVIRGFTSYMYVYRIPVPKGTTVIDRTAVLKTHSRLGEYLAGLKWTREHPWIEPYLRYRHYVVPDGVTEIRERTFEVSNLHSIRIPDSVTKIGYAAFHDCPELRSAELPDRLTEISYGMFRGCHKLAYVRIPEGVKTIGMFAFDGCRSLREIVLPDGLETFGTQTFSYSGLTRIRIPEGVKEIPVGCFINCTALREVELPGGVEQIGSNAFFGCHSLKTIVIPESVKTIGKEAFSDCITLEDVAILSPSVTVAPDAFGGRTHVQPDVR